MKVLVTGARGFIGRYVSEALLAQGHEVIAFDHHADEPDLEWPAGIELFLGDVRDSTAVTEAAAHVEGVIHLAAVLGTAETIDNPRPAAITNIQGSLNVFEAVAQYGLPAVYAGVGNHFMRTQGAGAYVIAKSCAEDFAHMFNAHRGTRIAVVRPMNAYGPRQSVAAPFGTSKVRKITPAFVCRALSGLPIEVYGDGHQISDMVFVSDVAATFVHALTYASTIGVPERAIEVGPEQSRTVNDVAELVADLVAEQTGTDPVAVEHLDMRPGEVPGAVVAADLSTMDEAMVDYSAFVPLEEGMARTVEWYAATEDVHWRRPALEAA